VPGRTNRIVFSFACFSDYLLCGLFPYAGSGVILFFADPSKEKKGIRRFLHALMLLHIALLIVSQFTDLYYTIDEQNIYHRSDVYFLSLIPPGLMLLTDIFVLIRRRSKMRKNDWNAFSMILLITVIALVLQIFFVNVVPISAMVCTLLLHIFFSERQVEDAYLQQQENLKLRTEIMLSQIQPHFLYNSLGAIRDTYRGDARRGEQAITEFAEYLRHNMDSLTEDQPIPLTEELKHVRCYLDLQKLRFGDDLNVAYDLECTDFLLPTLTLQPLVENAVTYGVRKSETGRGTVTIRSREYPDRWELGVIDDGPGFVPDSLPGDSERSHIGLRNVRERLQRACGGELRIDSVLGEGTTVTIILPREGT
jgi:signal transduction histidine kinase